MRVRGVSTIGLGLAALVHGTGAQASDAELSRLLERVAGYVRSYERSLSAVVCEEHYSQRALVDNEWQTRELLSDVALIQTDGDDWRLFRDVVAVDGVRLRDRDARLLTLFGSGRNPSAEAASITQESARYNIGSIRRTLNIPTLALAFLRQDIQERSSFKIAGRSRRDGRDIIDLRFAETGRPRLIYTRDRAAVAGRVWVDAEDGTVRGSQLRMLTEGTVATIVVTFSRDETLALWVPQLMAETYRTGGRRTDTGVASFDRPATTFGLVLEGNATYSACRRFSVSTRIK
jgi:hypothetical protein